MHQPMTKSGALAIVDGRITAIMPTSRTAEGIIHHNSPMRAYLHAVARVKNWFSAPTMSIAAKTYIRPVMKEAGIMASAIPRMMLPMPANGNDGLMPVS